jgi:septation ring formation regulator EzrA
MKEIRNIKKLRSYLSTLEEEVVIIKKQVADAQRNYSGKLSQIKKVKDEIEAIDKNENLKVSEHAIIRYLERKGGLDISMIESQILSEEVRCLVSKLGGNGTYPNKDFKVVMKNHTVVTIT